MKRFISFALCGALTMSLLCVPSFALKGTVLNPEEMQYISPRQVEIWEETFQGGDTPFLLLTPEEQEAQGMAASKKVNEAYRDRNDDGGTIVPEEEQAPEEEPEEELKQGASGQPSAWAAEEVEAAIARGLVFGLTDDPGYQDPITREQFAELAFTTVRAMIDGNFPHPAFDDCDNPWVLQAAGMGVVNGVGNNLFDPKATTNREQIAAMIYRAWDLVGAPVPPEGLDSYADSGEVSSWAVDAVGVMTASGIMKGTSDTTLSPKGPCTVEQAILLCYRLYHQIFK